MTDPQLQQQVLDAQFQVKGAEALLEQTKATLQNQLMDKRTSAAPLLRNTAVAKCRKKKDQLLDGGRAAGLDLRRPKSQPKNSQKQNDLAQKEVETFANSIDAQLAVQQAAWIKRKRSTRCTSRRLTDCMSARELTASCRSWMWTSGQRVTQGTALAKVAQPSQLKAALQIAETQAKDIQIGQKASIDTHNGVIPGHVIRIDPAVLNGTRTVDVKLDGPLPSGAVPQLSVEGTIELERLDRRAQCRPSRPWR